MHADRCPGQENPIPWAAGIIVDDPATPPTLRLPGVQHCPDLYPVALAIGAADKQEGGLHLRTLFGAATYPERSAGPDPAISSRPSGPGTHSRRASDPLSTAVYLIQVHVR